MADGFDTMIPPGGPRRQNSFASIANAVSALLAWLTKHTSAAALDRNNTESGPVAAVANRFAPMFGQPWETITPGHPRRALTSNPGIVTSPFDSESLHRLPGRRSVRGFDTEGNRGFGVSGPGDLELQPFALTVLPRLFRTA